jgi:threonyl-tRNA synthetase
MWDRATAMLRDVLAGGGIGYDTEEGEAAFYGPKIDVQVADSSEREASIATVQIDFYQPERFALQYTGSDGAQHRPVMVHRSVIGSAERAVAHLLDTNGGAFPPWLAPVQLVALPVSDAQLGPARALVQQAIDQGLRAEVAADGTLGARIRAHKLVPYLAVIGASEAAADEVSIRLRDGRRLPPLSAGEALAKIDGQVKAHTIELWDASS